MARARVSGFEHQLGSGTRAHRAARPQLAGLIPRGLIGYAHRDMSFGAWLEPPRPELTLQIALEGAIDADGEPLPTAWLGGLGHRPTVVGVGRTYAGVDLKLDPVAARSLLGIPLSELTDACVSLEDLFGAPAARELVERVAEAPDWDGRFDTLERFLAQRAGTAPDPAVGWAWRRLVETAGRIRVDAIAGELSCSRRYLTRRFAADLGLAPKAVARQLRLHALRQRVESSPGPVAWARLAAEHGYADQAHLTREFRELTGITPTEFLTRRIPEGGVVGDGL